MWGRSKRVNALFASPDTHRAVDRGDEDLAVTDAAGRSGLDDRLDDPIGIGIGHRDFQLQLGQKIDHILGSAIQLGVAFLAAESLDFGNRHAGHADLAERVAHVVEFERLDDGSNHFHGFESVVVAATTRFGYSGLSSLTGMRPVMRPDFQTLDEITRRLAAAVPADLKAARGEMETTFRSILESTFNRMDLVTREEFEIQKKVLARTREKLERLEAALAEGAKEPSESDGKTG